MAEVVIEDIEGILEEIAKNVDLTAENIHGGMTVIVDQEVDHISCTNSRKILPFADVFV